MYQWLINIRPSKVRNDLPTLYPELTITEKILLTCWNKKCTNATISTLFSSLIANNCLFYFPNLRFLSFSWASSQYVDLLWCLELSPGKRPVSSVYYRAQTWQRWTTLTSRGPSLSFSITGVSYYLLPVAIWRVAEIICKKNITIRSPIFCEFCTWDSINSIRWNIDSIITIFL